MANNLNAPAPNRSQDAIPNSQVIEGQVLELHDGDTQNHTAILATLALPSSHEGVTNPVLAYLAGLAPSGRRTMRGKLETVALMLAGHRRLEGIPWEQLRFEHVTAIRAQLEERGLSPATINATLYALRGVAKACWHLQLMSADDYGRLKAVRTVSGSRLPAGRSLVAGELAALLDACERGEDPRKARRRQSNAVSGVRDAALLAVLYIGGLRRSEAAALRLEHFDRDEGALVVRGKGNKERKVYLGETAAEVVQNWITLRGDDPGPLFHPVRKSGAIYKDKGVTDGAIYKALQKRALQAGVKSFSPHDLRRTFVGDLLDRGADIVTVQQLAGHASVTTTARYDRRGEERKKKAAHSLHFPAPQRKK